MTQKNKAPDSSTLQVILAKVEVYARNIRFESDYLEDTPTRSHILADSQKIIDAINELEA